MRDLASVWAGFGLAVACLALMMGCAQHPIPVTFDSDFAQSATSDGLYRTQSRRLATTLVRPGARFDLYDDVVIDPATLGYESPPQKANDFNWRSGNFELGPELTERMKRILHESLESGITGSGVYGLSAKAGPRTLRLRPHIVDLVYNVPPPSHSSEDRIVLRTGDMTLVLEIFDSQTSERLALLAERKAIKPTSSTMRGYNASSVNTWIAVRDVCDTWSRLLAGELRDYYDYAPFPAEPATDAASVADQP